jgi:Protein of unknown function (DUF669)
MPSPSDRRRTVDDILGGGSGDFNDLWDNTQAASDDFDPIPMGVYRCLVSDGKLSVAKSGTKSYKIEFRILEGDFAGRKLWHDCWLTRDAFAMTKRDLTKVGVTSGDALHHPPRSGIIADVKVALRTENDGRQHNRVNGFKVVADAPPPGTLDADEGDGEAEDSDNGEVDEDADTDNAVTDDSTPF